MGMCHHLFWDKGNWSLNIYLKWFKCRQKLVWDWTKKKVVDQFKGQVTALHPSHISTSTHYFPLFSNGAISLLFAIVWGMFLAVILYGFIVTLVRIDPLLHVTGVCPLPTEELCIIGFLLDIWQLLDFEVSFSVFFFKNVVLSFSLTDFASVLYDNLAIKFYAPSESVSWTSMLSISALVTMYTWQCSIHKLIMDNNNFTSEIMYSTFPQPLKWWI